MRKLRMTVALLSCDTGFSKGDAIAAAGAAPIDPFSAPCLSQRAVAGCGSQFWALAGDSSDEDDDEEESARHVPLRVRLLNVGDFLCEAMANP
jgi:hypothetical protein